MNLSKAIFFGPRLAVGLGFAVIGSFVLPMVGAMLRPAARAGARSQDRAESAAREAPSAFVPSPAEPALAVDPDPPEPPSPGEQRGYLGPEHIPV